MTNTQHTIDTSFDIDSDFDEEEFELRAAKLPFALKEEANSAYGEKDYNKAIKLWMQSVKETLKRSVRHPSADLYKNQITCRLNMAMAYLKLGDWVEAKEQAEVVLEQRPQNVKALYRLALALEKLQDWGPCEKALQALLLEADKAEQKVQENEKSEEPSLKVDLLGFTPTELRKLVFEMRHRIARDQAVYKSKSKKVFGHIGGKLNQIGASDDRENIMKTSDPLEDDSGLDDATLDQHLDDLFGIDLGSVIQWRHNNLEESKVENVVDTTTTTTENNKLSLMKEEEWSDPAALNSDDHLLVENNNAKNPNVLTSTAIKIIADSEDVNNNNCDDPKNPLWQNYHNVESLRKDRTPLILSLPLTVVHGIESIIRPSKRLAPKEEEDQFRASISPLFSKAHLSDISKRGRMQRRLLRSIYRQRHLTLHIIGTRGDVEMECQWTSILKRIPKLKTLQIICIGFNDSDDRWSRSLREGVLSPPLTKSQGLEGGKKLTCRLFKGLYQLFLKDYPDVLQRRTHPFYPDFVVVAEPRLSRYFNAWIPVFHTLIKYELPILLTGYSAVDFESHDAQNLQPVIKKLKGEWAVPIQPNSYAIKIKPEKECPPMQLWGLTEQIEFTGISAKNAVFGIVFGSTDPNGLLPDCDVDELKNDLKKICDVQSEEIQTEIKKEEKNEQKIEKNLLDYESRSPDDSKLLLNSSIKNSSNEVLFDVYDKKKEQRRLD